MIEEVGFKEGDDDVCALNLWYRWGEFASAALPRMLHTEQPPCWAGRLAAVLGPGSKHAPCSSVGPH